MKIQHHTLAREVPDLERIAAWPEVQGVIPGVIKPKRGPSTGITLQYRTGSGLKLMVRSGGAAQEVFVVTRDPQAVETRLRTEGIIPGAKS